VYSEWSDPRTLPELDGIEIIESEELRWRRDAGKTVTKSALSFFLSIYKPPLALIG